MSKDIAIIGIAGRLPMAKTMEDFLENLKRGVDCVREMPRQRIRETALPEYRPFRKGAYLDDIDKFDHRFFGISMAEAKTMCPEQRILLEVSYNAIENAGYSLSSISGSQTAVFVATAFSGYYQHASERSPTLITGNSPEFLAAKIGRHFNLKGNASVVDTTCSSSLVAVHAACNELLIGDAGMALVAGINLMLFPFSDEPGGLDTESPDGISRAFSAKANGMSYGEVGAAILLKPLEQALKDKDNIQAVIKSAAVNYNGAHSSSITAPDSRSQADVLLKAWRKAGINARDISFIEAHGSGTQLGDSLEFEALNLAFAEYTSDRHFCYMSTIKSNMGHGRNACGLAGMLKIVLGLKHRILFPAVHFDEPNPLLDYANSAVFLNKDLCSWNMPDGKARLAGITSLGWSGTNAHVVLQEGIGNHASHYPSSRDTCYHIPISAKTPASLEQNARALLLHLDRHPGLRIEDLCHTLTKGRDHYEYRLSYVVKNVDDLVNQLAVDVDSFQMPETLSHGQLIFIFSDSGLLPEEWIDNCKSRYGIFRQVWEHCVSIMPVSSPALKSFVYQYAFYKLLESVNIAADQLLPLGIGRIVLQLINSEITLAEAMNVAMTCQAEPIVSADVRVAKLLDRLKGSPCTLIDMAFQGTLHRFLHEYDSVTAGLCFIGPGMQNAFHGPLHSIMHCLYLRNYGNSCAYVFDNLQEGRKIELPAYQFEKIRCWLREKPKEPAISEGQKKANILREHGGMVVTKLAGIFASILDVHELSVQDDFFAIGGDSLRATRAIREIKKVFDVSLGFEDIFDMPRVGQLASLIHEQLDTVQKVSLAWESVLQCEHPGREDDFFELGGHSLMATQLIVLLNSEFSIQLIFEDIFRNSTIEKLADYIQSLQTASIAVPVQFVITPAPERASYPLTYAQKRMWFLNYFVGANSVYNNVFGICLDGPLDQKIFAAAFSSIIRKHESLRTVFRLDGEEPRQFIINPDMAEFNVEYVDLEGKEGANKVVDQLLADQQKIIFDLSSFPLFAATLVRLHKNRHVCVLNVHHIISDGWSMGVLLQEFNSCYGYIAEHKKDPAQSLPVQIKDYAEFQHQPAFEELMARQETYWMDQFRDTVPLLALPADHQRPPVQSFEGGAVYFALEKEEVNALKKIARENNATLYMVLLAAYNILLAKLGNTDDVVVGSPVAGRRFDGLQHLIGLFMNTIAIRNAPRSQLRFDAFLSIVKQRTLEAFNNQDYPYEELVKKVLTERDTSRNPLFDAMFILQNNNNGGQHIGPVKISPYPFPVRTARVDLVMEAWETDNGIGVQFEYATALFSKPSVERFTSCFRRIIAAIIHDTQMKIGNIEIIGSDEKDLVLRGFNNTAKPFPSGKTIHAVFEEVAHLNPQAIALSFGELDITYAELNEQSGRLAAAIVATGLQQGSVTGILMRRSPAMIVSMLAALKAGCCYLPIDPDYPAERIKYVVEDSGLGLMLTEPALHPVCTQFGKEVRILNAPDHIYGKEEDRVLSVDTAPTSLAYLIYTSGSTGNPKGVMITHRNVINFVSAMTPQIGLTPANSILCLTTVSFDIFVLETILPLLNGARVVLAGDQEQKDPLALSDLIRQQLVDYLQITPSHLKILLSACHGNELLKAIRVLMIGGEAFPADLLNDLQSFYRGRIFNMYGPTETTVWSTIRELTGASRIDIGKPIANTTIRILDDHCNLQPLGVPGELCIGGEGVAKGYWNREELTRDKFITDPYGEHQTIYRTGDLAKWLPDGNIECLGRIDNQVKIRGFRIEPGEIESLLVTYEGIGVAAVVLREIQQEKHLVAYYESPVEINPSLLKSYLSARLPYYMVPSFFLNVDRMPLTPNGKTDRRALPDPVISITNRFEPPSGDLEIKLAQIWSAVLNIPYEKIGTYDDFFALGGHSILAVRLIHLIQQNFHLDISLRKMFEHSMLESQAAYISKCTSLGELPIAGVGYQEWYPASAAQEGLYYEWMLNRQNLSYNVSRVYRINGLVDIPHLKKSLRQLAEKHDSLRTYFSIRNDQVVQHIAEPGDIEIQTLTCDDDDTFRELFEEFVKPFDLTKAPLIRFGLVHHPAYGNIFMVDIHHIVCDGISLNILMNHFRSVYLGEALLMPGIRYVDYACWQKSRVNGLEKQKEFWQKQLSGEWPQVDLPVVQERKATSYYRVSNKVLEIEPSLYQRIKPYVAATNVSDFMFMLSAYYILLYKMSGNTDVIIGTDAAGRTHPDLQEVVGTFINVLPLRVRIQPDARFEDFLSIVKNAVLDAFENQEFPIDQIIAALPSEVRTGRKLVQTHFSLANYLDQKSAFDNNEFVEAEIDDFDRNTQYEFKLEVHDMGNSMRVGFIFCRDLYDSDTIELLMAYYRNILAAVVAHPAIEIKDIDLEFSPVAVLQ